MIPRSVEKEVLLASGRRCCLCVFLHRLDEVRKGQIAHLNGDSRNSQFENLVWLCLEHHDEYDSRTSQAKGLTTSEVRAYRDRLYERRRLEGVEVAEDSARPAGVKGSLPIGASQEEVPQRRYLDEMEFANAPWHYPLWQVANQPEFFAYKAGNRFDGVCLIERIDLPDGRIVIACIEVAGNPGNSITNCVEELCTQVCTQFEIPPERLVWLEHYDYDEKTEWNMVTFAQRPPASRAFQYPKWVEMTPELWRQLRLRPKKKLASWRGHLGSKLTKLFDWPEGRELLAGEF